MHVPGEHGLGLGERLGELNESHQARTAARSGERAEVRAFVRGHGVAITVELGGGRGWQGGDATRRAMVRTSLSEKKFEKAVARARRAQARFGERYPGDPGARQPVHTVYGGAQLFHFETARKLGALALRALEAHAPDAGAFAEALGVPGALAPTVYDRVRAKLGQEPVEDFRIDFEDGYGNRPDAEEDDHAVAAAQQVAAGMVAGTLPPFLGIRIKPLTGELAARALRTLDVFLTELLSRSRPRNDHELGDTAGMTTPLPEPAAPDIYAALWLGALLLASGSTMDPFPAELDQLVLEYFLRFRPAARA